MPRDSAPQQEPQGKQFGTGSLVALVGSACCALLVPAVQQWEGKRNDPYQDIVGIWTVCWGDTANVRPGQRQTDIQCEQRLERQLIAHATPVLECVPQLAGRPHQLSASVSLAYNIGTKGFCGSTAAKHFRVGQWRAGCDAFLRWNKAGGKVVKGLQRRREAERATCLRGLV